MINKMEVNESFGDDEKEMVHFVLSATDSYLNYVPKLLTTINNFLPRSQYKYAFTFLVSCSVEWCEYNVINPIRQQLQNIEYIKFFQVPSFTWPTMTLYKPHLCLEYMDISADYVFCGNVNLVIEPNNYTWFDPNKINCTWHLRSNGQYYYIQGNFVLAKRELMQRLCEVWANLIDYYINVEHIVPDWHDETALNEIFNHNRYYFNPSSIIYFHGNPPEEKAPSAFIDLDRSFMYKVQKDGQQKIVDL